MIEPHIGLPVCVSIGLWQPRTRWYFFLAFFTLLVLSIIAVRPSLLVSYVKDVIPSHALSEAYASAQISATSVLVMLRVPKETAVMLGALQYAVMLVLGVWIARLSSLRFGAASLVIIPAAFAVFGGSYLHPAQLLFALPAVCLAVGHRMLAGIPAIAVIVGLFLSPLTLQDFGFISQVDSFAAFTAALFLDFGTFAALMTGTLMFILDRWTLPALPRFMGTMPVIASDPAALASQSWQSFIIATRPDLQGQLVLFMCKLPIWISLLFVLTLFTGSALLTQRPDDVQRPVSR